METHEFNLYYLVATLALGLLPFLAILVNIWLTTKSDLNALDAIKESKKANEIAQQALEISLFTHKGEIIPELVGYVKVQYPKKPPYLNVSFIVKNKSRGRAIINEISYPPDNFILVDSMLPNKDIAFPIEIRYNSYRIFSVEFKNKVSYKKIKELGSEYFIKRYFKNAFTNNVFETVFSVQFDDILGTPYMLNLKYSKTDYYYKGQPVEMDYKEDEDIDLQ